MLNYLQQQISLWQTDPQAMVDNLRLDYLHKLSNVSPHCDDPDNCGVNCPFGDDICLYRHLANRLSEINNTPLSVLAQQRINVLNEQLLQIQDSDNGSDY